MCFYALSATKYTTLDNGGTCRCICSRIYAVSGTDRNRRVLLYTTDLTTAIDVTNHCTIIDIDSRSASWIVDTIAINANHSFLTRECGCFTLTSTKHITGNISTLDLLISTHRVLASCCIITLMQLNSRYRTDIHSRITNDICGITSAIDITDSTQLVRIVCCCRYVIGKCAWNHIDVYRWISIHLTTNTVTTSEYLTDTRTRDDIQYWLSVCCEITDICILRIIILNRHALICCRFSRPQERLCLFCISI